jgi:hypothetical protein
VKIDPLSRYARWSRRNARVGSFRLMRCFLSPTHWLALDTGPGEQRDDDHEHDDPGQDQVFGRDHCKCSLPSRSLLLIPCLLSPAQAWCCARVMARTR